MPKHQIPDLPPGAEARNDQIKAVVMVCSHALAGKHPAIQSAALGELVSMWMATIPPEHYDMFWDQFAGLVRDLSAITRGDHPDLQARRQ